MGRDDTDVVEQKGGDVENQQQPPESSNDVAVEATDSSSSNKPSPSWWAKNRVWVVSVILIAVVAALTIGLSVGLTNRKNHHNNSSANAASKLSNDPKQSSSDNTNTSLTPTTETTTTTNTTSTTGGNNDTISSTTDNNGTTSSTTDNNGTTSVSNNGTISSTSGNNGTTIVGNNGTTSSTSSTGNNGTTSTGSSNDTTTTGPSSFAAASTLASFGPQALIPYSSVDDLTADLTLIVERLVNTTIDENIQQYFHCNSSTNYYCSSCYDVIMYAMGEGDGGAAEGGASSTSSSNQDTSSVSSFGTNNQVSGVDEADAVKSNGEYVFAVYGSDIVVVDPTNTTLLSRTSIPPPDIAAFYPNVNFSALNASDGGASDGGGSTGSSSGSSGAAANSAIFRPYPSWGCSSNVNDLLLFESRLVAIVTQSCYYYDSTQTVTQHILSGKDATVLFIYDISTVPGNLTFISQSTLQGYYTEGRSINSNAYIITNSYIDFYSNLLSYLDLCSLQRALDRNLTEAQYETQARQIARRKIPTFVSQLLSELNAATSHEHFIRLTQFQTWQDDNATDQQLGVSGYSALESLTLVTSFDVSQATSSSELTKSTAGMFLPTGGSTIYANEDYVIVAGQGWNRWWNNWLAQTYLLAFRLNGATVQAAAVGQVPGYAINQYSLDIHEGSFRIATTSSAQWDTLGNQTAPSTNQLYVLDFPADGSSDRTMSVVGSITNISVSETIQSVRFFGDKAYMSTFEFTDPFLTVDVSVPSAPRLVGELHVSGFSSYLHPIADGTQILAVGQNANETTGWTTGLQISLFDVSDFANPQQIQVYNVQNQAFGWSYSEVQWDFKAFRYLAEPQLLILPVSVNDYINFTNSFDGFVVYKIDPDAGISPSFTIEHASNYQIFNGCWSSAYLRSRNLVFSGNVLTLKGHTIKNHNLDSHLSVGSTLDLDADLNSNQCSEGYFFW